MPREARSVLAGLPLHIVQRGISRSPCFFADDDYRTYLHYLSKAAQRYACTVHAYCLMTNHVHLLVTPHETDACGRFMKHLGQCYVQTVNRRLERSGTLWEGRFRSSPVMSDEYVLACYRYIELNPVRAGMVSAPREYPWSSHMANASGRPDGALQAHSAYEGLGVDATKRAAAYEILFEDVLATATLEAIRKASRNGVAIGIRNRARGRPFKAKREK